MKLFILERGISDKETRSSANRLMGQKCGAKGYDIVLGTQPLSYKVVFSMKRGSKTLGGGNNNVEKQLPKECTRVKVSGFRLQKSRPKDGSEARRGEESSKDAVNSDFHSSENCIFCLWIRTCHLSIHYYLKMWCKGCLTIDPLLLYSHPVHIHQAL